MSLVHVPLRAPEVERHARDECGAVAVFRLKQPVGRSLLEQIEDDLHRLDEPELREPDAIGRPIVTDRNADMRNLALEPQCVEGFEPIQLLRPGLDPAMQLQQVDTLDLQTLQAGLDLLPQMPCGIAPAHRWRIVIGTRPHGWLDLCRHIDAATAPARNGLPDNALGAAPPIHLRGINEIDAALEGVVQRADGGGIVCRAPIATQLPGTKTDLADLPAGVSKRAIAHSGNHGKQIRSERIAPLEALPIGHD